MKKLFFCLIVVILCFQLISAIDTNIQIKTVPNMNVNVIVLSSTFDVYDRFNKDANEYGDVSFVFSSDKMRFGLTIFVKDLSDNSRVASEELTNQIAENDIYVEVVPKGFKIIETPAPAEENVSVTENLTESAENVTSNNTVASNDTGSLATITEKSEKNFSILGWSIFGEDGKLKKIIYYIFGAIILIVIIFFIFSKFEIRGKEIKVKKLSELRAEQKEATPESYYGILDETQKKLEDTQKELNQLKNKERIKETERKLQQDQQELRRLRGF